MIYALWFLLRLFVLIAAVVWVAGQSGAVELRWLFRGDEYQLNMALGVFGAAGLIFFVLVLMFYKLFLSLVGAFKVQRLKRMLKKWRKSQISVLKAMSSLSSDDDRLASKYAAHARRLNTDDTGMLDYLDGMISKSKGDQDKAAQYFKTLANHSHARALALNNLTSLQIEQKHLYKATKIAEYAYNLNPKQRWIVKTLYRLYIKQEQWSEAEVMRRVAARLKILSKDEARSDQVKLLHAMSIDQRQNGQLEDSLYHLKQAYKSDPKSLPVALDLLSIYLKRNENKKARKIVEALWPVYQHPQLIKAWEDLMPLGYRDDDAKFVRWWEQFLAFKPDCLKAQVQLGKIALSKKMYGQARAYLEAAKRLGESKGLYLACADLEREQYQDEMRAQMWINRALEVTSEQVWVCSVTGQSYCDWSIFTDDKQYFYTLEWREACLQSNEESSFDDDDGWLHFDRSSDERAFLALSN